MNAPGGRLLPVDCRRHLRAEFNLRPSRTQLCSRVATGWDGRRMPSAASLPRPHRGSAGCIGGRSSLRFLLVVPWWHEQSQRRAFTMTIPSTTTSPIRHHECSPNWQSGRSTWPLIAPSRSARRRTRTAAARPGLRHRHGGRRRGLPRGREAVLVRMRRLPEPGRRCRPVTCGFASPCGGT